MIVERMDRNAIGWRLVIGICAVISAILIVLAFLSDNNDIADRIAMGISGVALVVITFACDRFLKLIE
jgi:hypothetical protein